MDQENDGTFDLAMKIPRIISTISQFPGSNLILVSDRFATDEQLFSQKNFGLLAQRSADQIRKVKVRARFQMETEIVKQRLGRFLAHHYPRVESVMVDGDVIDKQTAKQIFSQCPNIRRADLANVTIEFPTGLECQLLAEISSDKCSVESLTSIFRQAPRLNLFEIKRLISDDDVHAILNVLADVKPKIESIDVLLPSIFSPNDSQLLDRDINALCRLRFIQSLSMRSGASLRLAHVGQLVQSMSAIKVLKLDVATIDREAAASFGGFVSMRELSIEICRDFDGFEEGLVEYLAQRPKLVALRFEHVVQSNVIVAAVQYCASLKLIRTLDVKDVTTVEKAADFVRAIVGVNQCQLILEIEFALSSIWHSENVRNELAKENGRAGQSFVINLVGLVPKVEANEWVQDVNDLNERGPVAEEGPAVIAEAPAAADQPVAEEGPAVIDEAPAAADQPVAEEGAAVPDEAPAAPVDQGWWCMIL